MTFIQNPPVADGSVTTAKLGGDVTAVAKVLLQAATEKDQRQALDLSETATYATGAMFL